MTAWADTSMITFSASARTKISSKCRPVKLKLGTDFTVKKHIALGIENRMSWISSHSSTVLERDMHVNRITNYKY